MKFRHQPVLQDPQLNDVGGIFVPSNYFHNFLFVMLVLS